MCLIPSLASRSAGFVLATKALLSFVPAVQAQTDYLREFAKNKPRILIVASGPEAMPIAKSLQQSLQRNGDFRGHRPEDATVASPDEAEKLLAGRDWQKSSVVLCLTGKDLQASGEALPPRLALLLPFEVGLLRGPVSVVQGAKDADRPGEPLYRVGLYAPDGGRLKKVYDRLVSRRADNFRDLAFIEKYTTNRIAVFSPPEYQTSLADWGRVSDNSVWNEIQWHPLTERAEITPEQLAECAEVYFVDRSAPDATKLPEPARQALETQPITPTTVAVARREGVAGENPVLVVTAPSKVLLETRMERLRTVDALRREPPAKETLDLSRLGSTSLLIVGGGKNATADFTNSLHVELAGAMRQRLSVAVEPRGPVLAKLEGDLALQMAQGATDTRGVLHRKYPTRYVWVFSLTDLSGGTVFHPSEKKLTADPGSFDEGEPGRPVRRRDESDYDYEKRRRDWRDRWDGWDRRRREWNDHYRFDPCEWELTVTRENVANVRGQLQLLDTRGTNGPAFVWEKECTFTLRQNDVYRTQRATVRGHDNQPNLLDVPPSTDRCPGDLLLTCATKAAGSGLTTLREEALLPTGEVAPLLGAGTRVTSSGPTPPAIRPQEPTAVPPSRAKVAEVEGQIITLNVGSRQGVHVGDRYEVLLQYKETTDPDNGRILRIRVQESFVVVVTQVDAEAADAKPATPADAAKLARAKVGMVVRRLSP